MITRTSLFCVFSGILLLCATCDGVYSDEALVGRALANGAPEIPQFVVDQKLCGEHGCIYIVRAVYSTEPTDTGIGLVALSSQDGRKYAFLWWGWTMKDAGGTTYYMRQLAADSVRFEVGPGEWWKDSIFWKRIANETPESARIYEP